MKKKIVSFILVISISLALCTTVAFAFDDNGPDGPRCIARPIITLNK